jgi:hypothetical protein
LDLVVGSSVQQQVLPSSQQLLPFLRWDLPCLRQVILFAIHFFFEKFLHFLAWWHLRSGVVRVNPPQLGLSRGEVTSRTPHSLSVTQHFHGIFKFVGQCVSVVTLENARHIHEHHLEQLWVQRVCGY